MENSFPYINNYGKIESLFGNIKKATVPQKFTNDFLSTILGFKSTSDRPIISFLKRLGFLEADNSPSKAYKDYRMDNLSKKIMGQQIKKYYEQLFSVDENAHKLTSSEIKNLIKRVTGWGETDQRLPSTVNTFENLKKLADFSENLDVAEKQIEEKVEEKKIEKKEETRQIKPPIMEDKVSKKLPLGFSYTINLNLPETTDIEVFNAIFKSLKEILLNEE